MFARLAKFVSRHWLLVLLAWVAIAVGAKFIAPRWDDVTHDGDFAYLPARMTSVRGEKLVAAAFPDLETKSQVVLIVARPGGELLPGDKEIADWLAQQFMPTDDKTGPIASVMTYRDDVVGQKLISPVGPSGQAVLVMLQLRNEFMAVGNLQLMSKIDKTLKELAAAADFPQGLKLGVSGSAAIGADMLLSAKESIDNTEITTVLLVVFILLMVYRAPGLVIIPLLAIGISMTVSIDVVAMVAGLAQRVSWLDFKVFRTTQIFIVVMLYGAVTDYCLFLISRYREELQRGLAPAAAIEEALSQVGHAVAASAMTTILGLSTMVFADFGKFRNGGPTIAMALTVALASSLTLAPALLRAAGRWVFWPFGVGKLPAKAARASGSRRGFWEWVAGVIVTRPGLVFVGGLAILSVPAAVGFGVPVTYDFPGELSQQRPSIQGTRLLENYFPTGETGPISVLAHREGVDFDSREGRKLVSLLTKELNEFSYTDGQGRSLRPVNSVRSLTNPLGEPPGSLNIFSERGRRTLAAIRNPRTKATYLSNSAAYAGSVTRLDLVCQYDPFAKEGVKLFVAIEKWLQAMAKDPQSDWHGAEFDFIGTTAGIRDLEAVNTSDYYRTTVLTSLAVLAVLVFLLRRQVISLFLIFTVLLGYFVTIGVSKYLFMWVYGDTFHGVDWKLPVFLFVILVAVGEDYNIYLATRVFEEQRRLGALEGLRVAVIRTGGIITSCGVIMAGTFASMISGTLRSMHELGFALAFGVILDTFVIRTILVPAFLALWARWIPEASSDKPPQPAHHLKRRGERVESRESRVESRELRVES
ncbi:MAG: MMPL family transporter [Thermoguttaceae bacterium]